MKTYLKHTALYISRAIVFQFVWRALTGRALDRKWEEQKQDIACRSALAVTDELAERAKLEFPYSDGNTLILGPECFANEDETVICWRGLNYYANYHGDE